MDTQQNNPRRIAIVGGGPAGLMAAETAAQGGAQVTIFDRMPSLGRKFLMAGRGGLNLTHSEPLDVFLTRYGSEAARLRPALVALTPDALRAWSAELGEETFVGSSGRVFPKSFKASPLLRAWLRRLEARGVTTRLRSAMVDIDAGWLTIETNGVRERLRFDAIVLALGGASWPRLGSDGGWAPLLAARGVALTPFAPANSGALTNWSPHMRKHAGAPLKNVTFSVGDASVRGECVVTETGLEGGAIYALSRPLRDALNASAPATLRLDLRPDMTREQLAHRFTTARPGESTANQLRKAAGLSPAAAALLREAGPLPSHPAELAARIKATEVRITGQAGLARAISTAGGVAWNEIDERFMLKRLPGVFVAGEMLDWEAPTGGYLLQACFATGTAAGGAAASFAPQ